MRLVLRTQAVQLVSAIPSADLWEELTSWFPTTGVVGVRGVLVLAERLNGNFQARVGIQTATDDVEVADAPLSPRTGTGLGYVTTVSKNFYDFDPTVSDSGDISTKAFFRIGVLYSSVDGVAVSRGDVALRVSFRR